MENKKILEGLTKLKVAPCEMINFWQGWFKEKEKTYTAANIKNEKGDIISYPADIKKKISKLYATNLKIYKNG